MKWFNFYVAHNSKINASNIKQYGDSSSIIVSKDLTDKFDLQDLPGVFQFSKAPLQDIAWLEGDLTKADSCIHKKLFGQPIKDYKVKINEIGFRDSIILSCPLPSMQLRAMPIEFGAH